MSNHVKLNDMDNIVHCLFSLEKIVKMSKVSVLGIVATQEKKIYLLPKDKVRRKLWLNAIGLGS